MEGGKSAEYFNSCWDGNDYCCRCKICSCVYIYAYSKHVVSSYDEAEKANSHYCSDHAYVSERFFFARVVGDNVRDYTEAREDEDIDFRVSEESEQMLVQDWVSSAGGVKEGGI